jgi:hypothetical protein
MKPNFYQKFASFIPLSEYAKIFQKSDESASVQRHRWDNISTVGENATAVKDNIVSVESKTPPIRVLCHFRFKAKWSETEAKYFCLFRIDAKRRNLKRKENETKQKGNEKEAKTAVIFASKRNEAKRKQNFFTSMRKKCFFSCFRIWIEMKRKQNEKEAKR